MLSYRVVSRIFIIVGIAGLVSGAGLASEYFQICHRSDPQLVPCVKQSIKVLTSQLKKGIPALGVPSVDPLRLDYIPFNSRTNNKGFVNNLTNVAIWGILDTDIHNVTTKLTKNSLLIRMKMLVPTVRIEGTYDMDTKIAFVQLKGNGFIQINATDVLCDFLFRAHRVPRNGEEYLQFERMTGTMDMRNARIYLQSFKDPTLNKATNDIVNDNFNLLFEDIKPSVLDALFKYFTDIANKVTKRFTLNELLPK